MMIKSNAYNQKDIHRLILIILIFITLIFFIGCQPTPEDLIVENKNDNDLENAINSTMMPNSKLTEINHINFERINKRGNVSIYIDADIITPDVDNIPVAYIEQNRFTQEQIDQILFAYLGDATMYDSTVLTKQDIEIIIINLEKNAIDLDSDLAQSNGITNLTDLRKIADLKIADYKEMWKTAPQKMPEVKLFDISSNEIVQVVADTGSEQMTNVIYTNSDIFYKIVICNFGGTASSSRRFLESYSSKEIDISKVNDGEFLLAKQNAELLLMKMNIEGYKMGSVYLSDDEIHVSYGKGSESHDIGMQFYVFCFEKLINGMTLDNSFYAGTHSNNTLNPDDSCYDKPMPYEVLQVWTFGSKIVQFNWEQPIKVTEILNNNVNIQIGINEAIEKIVQQLFIMYADRFDGHANSIKININKIQFALARIKEKDTGMFLAVPVLDFYGDIVIELDDQNATELGIIYSNFQRNGNFYTINNSEQSIITINLLDGSIINKEVGY